MIRLRHLFREPRHGVPVVILWSNGLKRTRGDNIFADYRGEHLEFTAEAGPGDFIYVPPFVPHQEINASKDEMLSCDVSRSGQEPIVVNLDIESVEPPEEVYWVDPSHPHP